MISELKPRGNPEVAARLRELADDIESGEVGTFSVIALYRTSQVIFSMGNYDDRLSYVGMLEQMKSDILAGGRSDAHP